MDSRDTTSPGGPSYPMYDTREAAQHNKDLLSQLRTGINGLEHLRSPGLGLGENNDPNVRAKADANLSAMRAMHPSMG